MVKCAHKDVNEGITVLVLLLHMLRMLRPDRCSTAYLDLVQMQRKNQIHPRCSGCTPSNLTEERCVGQYTVETLPQVFHLS